MIFKQNKKRHYFLAVIFLFVAPLVCSAISSTSYIIDPSGTGAIRNESNSTTYSLESAIELISGNSTATNYVLESGSSFAGYCGDGFIDPTEDCEGSNLNSKTCVTQGFVSGTLSCASNCVFNTSSCSSNATTGGHDTGTINPPTDPTFDSSILNKTYTYADTLLIFGDRSSGSDVSVNGSTSDVTYATNYLWQKYQPMALGLNTIVIKATGANGSSSEVSVTIKRRKAADANDDGAINDYDFSLYANHYNQTGSNGYAADFTGDGTVNDYDLSVMSEMWGR